MTKASISFDHQAAMIARLWRGVAHTSVDADAYLHGGHVEFLVMTFWDSMDAVRRFAGENPERAVVEPEARAVLGEYDDFVRHYEVER